MCLPASKQAFLVNHPDTIYSLLEVYRLLKEPYWHDPLSVVGAEIAGGRWNPPGIGILYTASSPALALLETLVHFPRVPYEQLPRLRVFSLKIPDDAVRWIDPEAFPDEWAEPIAISLTQALFSEWLTNPTDLALAVPSAVMDISFNFILHPKHPRYKDVIVTDQNEIRLDGRLWRA